MADKQTNAELDGDTHNAYFKTMSATSLLTIKQSVTKLTERERRDLSVFLHRLRQDTPSWKRETAKRLAAMEAGSKTSVADLRKRLNEK